MPDLRPAVLSTDVAAEVVGGAVFAIVLWALEVGAAVVREAAGDEVHAARASRAIPVEAAWICDLRRAGTALAFLATVPNRGNPPK